MKLWTTDQIRGASAQARPEWYNADEVDALIAEECDAQKLCERLSELLNHTAIVLKGPSPSLCLHSWHDLPDVAASLMLFVGECADAPAVSPDGRMFIECQSEDGQTGTMDVDPIGWIQDMQRKAHAILHQHKRGQPAPATDRRGE